MSLNSRLLFSLCSSTRLFFPLLPSATALAISRSLLVCLSLSNLSLSLNADPVLLLTPETSSCILFNLSSGVSVQTLVSASSAAAPPPRADTLGVVCAKPRDLRFSGSPATACNDDAFDSEGGSSIHSGRELAAFSACSFAASSAACLRASLSRKSLAPSLRPLFCEEEACVGSVGPTDGPTSSFDETVSEGENDGDLVRERVKPEGKCGPAIARRGCCRKEASDPDGEADRDEEEEANDEREELEADRGLDGLDALPGS